MNEDPLQREIQDVSERPRAGLALRLVEKPAQEHAVDTEAGELAPATKYALARMNVIMLGSARETPEQGLLGTEFSFAQDNVGSVVIHTCMTSNNRQSAHGWLFQSCEPDLLCDRPVAELAISSTGESSVTPGCPPDYDALRVRVLPAPVAAPLLNRVRRAKPLLFVALGAAVIVAWIAFTMVWDRAGPSQRASGNFFAVTPWIATSAVNLPLPIVLPTTTPPPRAAVEVVKTPAKPRPVTRRPKQAVAQATRQKPQVQVERSAEQPRVVQGASTLQAPVSEPRRVVLAERAAPVVVETGAQRLAREQALCEDRGFVGRAFCREGARWRHCHPDKWDLAPECMVKADAMQ